MPAEPLTSPHLRGVALSITICTILGAIWGVSGSAALPGVWRWGSGGLMLAVTVLLLRTAERATSAPPGPSVHPFRTPAYRLAVGAEIIAIPIAGRVLTANGFPEAVMPAVAAVAAVVGLHFFGLVPAFRSRYFAWVGAAFCGLALTALALPVQVSSGVARWGCGPRSSASAAPPSCGSARCRWSHGRAGNWRRVNRRGPKRLRTRLRGGWRGRPLPAGGFLA